VKLFRESAFKRADVELTYIRKFEKISQIEAFIYLPEGGVKKLTSKDIFWDRYDDERDVWRITFPNVTEGVVIEYAYLRTNKGIATPSRYYFQENIPVRWAEYKASIPVFFKYISLGNSTNFTANNRVSESRLYGKGESKYSGVRWAYENLPAYEEQPYVNNFIDYIPQVRLQLKSVHYPERPVYKVFSDWKETTRKINSWASFGKNYINKGNSSKVWKAAEPYIDKAGTETEKIKLLYNFVAGKISWDGSYSWTSERTPNKVFETAKGNSGEISMMLLALLRTAGIESQPILVPLRNSGSPIELYPLITQFSHLMILATVDGKDIILDPNDLTRPPGLPRVKALNHRVFVANPDNPHWINLNVPKATQIIMANVAIDEEGMADAEIKSRMTGYYAFGGRKRIQEMEQDAELPIIENITESYPDAEVVSHEIKEEENMSSPLFIDFKLKAPMGEAIDNYLYVQPILSPILNNELVDAEQRLYPVDFAYPWMEQYVTTISIPSGYAIDELPESIRLRSEDGTMSCSFAATEKEDSTISINFVVNIDRTKYEAAEYDALRGMFNRIIELQESTIVLKRAR
jgi:transglutaminase-like putative cysteine protease